MIPHQKVLLFNPWFLWVIIIFSFSLPTLSSFSNGSATWAPKKLVVSPQWRFHSFLMHWIKSRPDFFMRKPFLWFLLSFFINYVAMSAFCLRGKSFNEDRNHHQYTIGTALRKPFLEFLLSFFINYVAMLAFCLCDKSFNEDKNHHQYII